MSNQYVAPHDTEDRILRSLRQIVRAIDLHSRRLESEYGLTGPQLVCLRTIALQGPMTPGELARRVELSQGTVTGIVDRLARRQYVSRRRDAKDRRRLKLAALPAGQALLESAPSPLQTRFAKELESLPAENQIVIATMLEQIVRMMGAEDLDAALVMTRGAADAPGDVGSDEPLEDGPDLTLVGSDDA